MRHKQKKNWKPSCLCGCNEHRLACLKCQRWLRHQKVRNVAWCENPRCVQVNKTFTPKPFLGKD